MFTRGLLVPFVSSLMVAGTSTAFAQNQSKERLQVVTGTVEKVFADVIFVTTGAQLIALSVDGHTGLWKGKPVHDLSTVEMAMMSSPDTARRLRASISQIQYGSMA